MARSDQVIGAVELITGDTIYVQCSINSNAPLNIRPSQIRGGRLGVRFFQIGTPTPNQTTTNFVRL